jgi:hypothetical protein
MIQHNLDHDTSVRIVKKLGFIKKNILKFSGVEEETDFSFGSGMFEAIETKIKEHENELR